jgi:DNA-binding phage protein
MAKARADEIDVKMDHVIRRTILERKLSGVAVAAAAGVAPACLHRFLSFDRGMTLETAGKVAAALGLVLVETRRGLR